MKSNNKIISFLKALFVNFYHINIIEKIERAVKSLRPAEKIIFYVCAILMAFTSIYMLFQVNKHFLVEVPAYGGNFVEGVLGSPRFINPVLAISDTDKDMTSLIYGGLLKMTPNGFVNDIAESFSISNDGLNYNVLLRSNVFFHDGNRVTADDVIFTIEKALDSTIKSPRRPNWEGVSVQKISDRELTFTLKKPYSPFIETLTMGILPKHIWEDASSEEFPFSELNVNPIGSGPYKVESIKRNSAGILTSISLSSFDKFTLGRPKIDTITFKFYQNESDLEQAFDTQEIESVYGVKVSKQNTERNLPELRSSLPRIFGVFFNQNISPIFLDKDVRKALDIGAPKEKIVQDILYGYGKAINGPSPYELETYSDTDLQTKSESRASEARALLEKSGWKLNENGVMEKKTKSDTLTLKFALSTSDAPELKSIAELLKSEWQKIGADIEVKVFEAGDLSQNVIRPRKYEALLFGEVINQSGDLYPFWHSSQRNDPGLNIALYANITTDKLLEDIRNEIDPTKREEYRALVVKEIQKDSAAVFLFSPQMIYTKAKQINNVSAPNVSYPSDRFSNIHNWYIETDNVWKFFANI